MNDGPAVMWFRRDLRLSDNPAWTAATTAHDDVVALFVIDPRLVGNSPRRDALLFGHLRALDRRLAELGGALRVRVGDPVEIVVQEAGPDHAVYWNDDASAYARRRDEAVAAALGEQVHRFAGLTVHPPGTVLTKSGGPYRVFTPFYRAWRTEPWDVWDTAGSARIAADAGEGIPDTSPVMAPGEVAALERLEAWLERVDEYETTRNHLEPGSTSELSADLHFGTIDARRIRAEVGESTPGRAAFVRQLAWRDFSFQALSIYPDAADRPIRPEYGAIEWRQDADGFEAWRTGTTGYPIVDAAMRQLATEGWMPNRMRMVVASFLVKDLLVDWRLGERHFRRELIDGDLAQNVINWQWVAGTGLDAAPYFRVFNPVAQGERHDPEGAYVRRWVPELAGIEGSAIHAPWTVPPLDLAAAGVTLGVEYPAPIVDHKTARERTIDAYKRSIEEYRQGK
ncbi:MAG: deoxyribodipyrimidine photo-lyase [Acidimicrobiia bacterium]|nr:deoxyribodipyrimidine photo-lyase [Acidimicrobiia bacterium]